MVTLLHITQILEVPHLLMDKMEDGELDWNDPNAKFLINLLTHWENCYHVTRDLNDATHWPEYHAARMRGDVM